MTVKEAIELEKSFEKGLYGCADMPVEISYTLDGRFRVREKNSNNYILFNKYTEIIDYIKFTGYTSDLTDFCNATIEYIESHKEEFDKLVWSYEHQSELIKE